MTPVARYGVEGEKRSSNAGVMARKMSLGDCLRACEIDFESRISKVLRAQEYHYTLCRQLVLPCLHTRILHIFCERRKPKRFLLRRRRKRLDFLNAIVGLMLASDQLEDKTAVEFLPDFIEWFCEMLRNPRLRPLGKFDAVSILCFFKNAEVSPVKVRILTY